MISLENITLQRGAKLLLESASARIHTGQKVALIGANGVGKSSLFQLFLHHLHTDGGDLRIPADWRVAHMAQEVAASNASALDYVLDGDRLLRDTEKAIAEAEGRDNHPGLAELYQRYDELGGYSAAVRAEKLLHGLGFGSDEISRPVKSFSGGWRIRLNLAQALMCPSDLLLLDEPTNHLDIDASLWLEDWLKQYSGTLILISHDRDFIDSVCDLIVQIEHRQLWTYRGNYSAFERQRAERLARDQATFEKQQRRVAEIHQFVRRFKAKASKARQAQSRVKELERMELLAPAHVDSPFDFSFPVPERFSDPLLSIDNGVLGYADKAILEKVSLSIHPGSRIGLLGANGAGKSTLMATLVGDLPLLAGQRTAGEHLKIGYFSQHQVDALDMDASPILHLQRLSPQATEQSIRNFLGSFNFRGDMAKETIVRFSGGEKARLALAVIVWQNPNLLLLDEPTNHLDLEMRHALTVALQGFEGAMVLVSHDRHLIRNTVDQLLLVSDGRVSPYEGDLEEYSRWLLSTLKAAKTRDDGDCSPGQGNTQDKKRLRQQTADIRKQLAPLKKIISGLETKVEKLDEKLVAIDHQLADVSLYEEGCKERLQALLVEKGALNQQKEDLEARWLEQLEQLEAMEVELGQ
jgi:ATP-binding cassette subfamily F protein 3